jgi:ribosomal protein S21
MGRRTPVHVEIYIRDQEQFERMVKKFTRKVKKSGVLEEVRERRYYTKPSTKRNLAYLKRLGSAGTILSPPLREEQRN